jgi:anti-anti-sigma factor
MLNVFQPSQFVTEVNAQEIRDWVKQSLASGAKDLLIDFSDVQFINSSGLGALAIALKMVRENDSRLALCGLNPQTKMTLEISGMYEAFAVFDNQDEFIQNAPVPAMQKIA